MANTFKEGEKMTDENYEPFGSEWKKEMMKLTKPELVDFLRGVLIKKMEVKNDRS